MINFSRKVQRGRLNNIRQNPRDHCEFSFAKTDFWGPISTGLNVFKFRPGDSGIDFLDQFSIHFSQYRIAKNLSIKYTSAVSTTSNGQVSIGIDYHGKGQVSTLLDVQSLAGARTTNVYKEVITSADALTAMKSHWHTIHQPGSRDETLQTAFTLYVFVYGYTTPNSAPTSTPEIGQIQVTYDVVFSGPRAVGASRIEEPAAITVSKTTPVINTTIVQTEPVNIQDDPEETINPEDPNTPAVLDALATNTLNEEKTTNLVLPADDIEPGDTFSVLVTDKSQQALSYANSLNGVGSISGATVITGYSAPKVNLFYANGTPVPTGVIKPIDTPTIGGVKQNSLFFAQNQNYSIPTVGGPVIATNADGTTPNFTDFLGDVFKVVDTVAEGVGLVANIVGSFLESTDVSIVSKSSTVNAVNGTVAAPEIAAIFPGDSLDQVLPPLATNNLWDSSLFGFRATMDNTGTVQSLMNFDGDWSISHTGTGSSLAFTLDSTASDMTHLLAGDRLSIIVIIVGSSTRLFVPTTNSITSLSPVASAATLGATAGAGSTNSLANVWQANHVADQGTEKSFTWINNTWSNADIDIFFLASRVPGNLEIETFTPQSDGLANELNKLVVSRN